MRNEQESNQPPASGPAPRPDMALLRRPAKMNRRIALLLGAGAFILALGYVVLPLALEKWTMPAEPEYAGYFSPATGAERESGLAPVQLWYEASPEFKGFWRAQKAARLRLVHGEAFAGDVLVRKEKIREYLDAMVQRGEIDYVIVFPEKNGKWGDIFPILDECRRSRVRIVFLNQYEA